MVPFGCRFSFAVALLMPLVSSNAAFGAEPAPPSDAEIAKFVGIENGLVADSGRAAAICTDFAAAKPSDSERSSDPAVVGRRLEASPIIGPLLRRNGISGQRFTEVSVHVVAALIGLAIADDADATARRQGKPAGNREGLLANSAAARVVAAHQKELTASLEKFRTLCDDESSGDEGDESEE